MKEEALSLAKELALPTDILPRLAAAPALPPELLSRLAAPETASAAWTEASAILPPWETDGGFAQLAAVLDAACLTREAYRRAHIPDPVFLDTFACLPRFLEETKTLLGRYAFDRGFWTWRQTGCLLFRLGALEFEYAPAGRPLPGLDPDTPVLFVHIPSDASLARDALDSSYARARALFAGEAFCRLGPPQAILCASWLLAPALDQLLPETSGIRRFAGDYERLLVREDNTEFYRWLFQRTEPAPPQDLPAATSLQRAVRDHLASGGKIGMAWGRL